MFRLSLKWLDWVCFFSFIDAWMSIKFYLFYYFAQMCHWLTIFISGPTRTVSRLLHCLDQMKLYDHVLAYQSVTYLQCVHRALSVAYHSTFPFYFLPSPTIKYILISKIRMKSKWLLNYFKSLTLHTLIKLQAQFPLKIFLRLPSSFFFAFLASLSSSI